MKNTDWKAFAEKIKRADADTRKKIGYMIDRLLEKQEKKAEERNR